MDARAHIIVSGMVQGVGYRYFVMKAAHRLQLTGCVRNLPSGEVEIVTEGPRGLIDELIRVLPTGNSWARVNHVDLHWEEHRGEFTGFDITY
jgi:acylphosphatase